MRSGVKMGIRKRLKTFENIRKSGVKRSKTIENVRKYSNISYPPAQMVEIFLLATKTQKHKEKLATDFTD